MAATMSPAFAARSPTGVLIPIARKMNVLTMSAPVLRVLKIEIFVRGLVACAAIANKEAGDDRCDHARNS